MTAKLISIAFEITVVLIMLAGHLEYGKASGYLMSNGLTRNGKNVCEKEVSRMVSYQTKKTKVGYSTYKIRCPGWWNWFGWRKCTKKKTITKYYQVVAYRKENGKQLYCCDGWSKNSNNECLAAVCTKKCVINQGVCIAPNSCRCIAGWTGESCDTDVNECNIKNGNCEQTCTNIEGSYDCHCRLGYQKVDKFRCEDINECSTNSHSCHKNANCTNTVGSFNCTCHGGYTGNGVTCVEFGATLAPQTRNVTNTSEVFQPLTSNDSQEGRLTTIPQDTTTEHSKPGTTKLPSTTSPAETATASVTFYCSGYVPGSDETERTELMSTVTKASGGSGLLSDEIVKNIETNAMAGTPPTLAMNDHGFSITIFYPRRYKEHSKTMFNHTERFYTAFRNSTVNCTFNDANVKQWMINKPKNETTTLSWQMALVWVGGVLLFILLGVVLVILRTKRKSNWITIVHAPYIYQHFSRTNDRNTVHEEQKLSKRPLLDSDDDYDFRPDDMA